METMQLVCVWIFITVILDVAVHVKLLSPNAKHMCTLQATTLSTAKRQVPSSAYKKPLSSGTFRWSMAGTLDLFWDIAAVVFDSLQLVLGWSDEWLWQDACACTLSQV